MMDDCRTKINLFLVWILSAFLVFVLLGMVYVVLENIIQHRGFDWSNYRIHQHVDRDPPNTSTFRVRTDVYFEHRNISVNLNSSQIDENVRGEDVAVVLEKQQKAVETIIEQINEEYQRRGMRRK